VSANFWQGRKLAARATPPPTAPPAAAPTAIIPAGAPPSAAVAALSTAAAPPDRRPSIPSFLLASGVLRGSGSMARVLVPEGAVGVRLVLAVPRAEYSQYRATLRSAEGDELWTATRLRAEEASGRAAVAILLPSELLSRGDYLVALDGVRESGEPESVASYAFRVTAK
jgi:hypothetical protein